MAMLLSLSVCVFVCVIYLCWIKIYSILIQWHRQNWAEGSAADAVLGNSSHSPGAWLDFKGKGKEEEREKRGKEVSWREEKKEKWERRGKREGKKERGKGEEMEKKGRKGGKWKEALGTFCFSHISEYTSVLTRRLSWECISPPIRVHRQTDTHTTTDRTTNLIISSNVHFILLAEIIMAIFCCRKSWFALCSHTVCSIQHDPWCPLYWTRVLCCPLVEQVPHRSLFHHPPGPRLPPFHPSSLHHR